MSKKGKKKADDADDMALLEELKASAAPPAAPAKPAAPATVAGASKKDKLAEAAAALLSGLAPTQAAKKEEAHAPALAAAAAAAAPDAEEDGEGDGNEAAAAGGSAAAKKKKKKKAAAEPKPEPVEEAPKLNKAALRAQELMAARKKAEEEAARLAEEDRLREEEERKAEEEKLRLELEEKERKKKKRLEKKERDLALGKPVTKAEKEKQRLLEERRKQLLASGLVRPDAVQRPAKAAASKKDDKPSAPAAAAAAAALAAPIAAASNEAPPPAAPASSMPEARTEAPPPPEEDLDWDKDDFSGKLNALGKVAQAASESVDLAAAASSFAVAGGGSGAGAPKKPAASGKPAAAPAKKPAKSAAAAATTSSSSASASQSKAQSSKKAASASSEDDSEEEDDDDDDEEEDSEESSSDEDSSSSEDGSVEDRRALHSRIAAAREKRLARVQQARADAIKQNVLRAPIICVLGHVDTGKTKTLDMLRKTNVQEGEAGGITQQIGATFFPVDKLRLVTDRLGEHAVDFRIPGLQIIDTPGHESFSNLRSRGSGLADVAIVVIDIMHGLEKQTIESLELLRQRKTRFVVALNKIDRLYGWKVNPGMPVRQTLAQQSDHVQSEFATRVKQVITGLMELSFNAALYWENKDLRGTVCIVPTSAVTGEGSPDLLMMLTKLAQDQMSARLAYSRELECTVLEVKKIEGLGTTMDVILVNGELHDDDTLVVATSNGPIVTQVRTLLTPQPMREMRVKNEYIVHKSIKGCMGVKITANDLDHVVAGTSVYVVTPDDDVEELKDAVMGDVKDVMGDISTEAKGVFVQASTLGSLEALMEYLRSSKVPVAGVALGPVHKKDVVRASAMVEYENEREFATILAFDVKVDPTATELADELGVKIFTADIIYHLTDQFSAYVKDMREERKKRAAADAVFPCIVKIIPGNVFNSKNPLVVGVDVVRGCVVLGTPLVVPDKLVDDPFNPGQKMMLEIGRVVGIEKDKVAVPRAVRGEKVCIKIQGSANESHVQIGRHFETSNALVSKLSRKSIDLLKQNFKPEVDELKSEGWPLIQMELKKVFGIA